MKRHSDILSRGFYAACALILLSCQKQEPLQEREQDRIRIEVGIREQSPPTRVTQEAGGQGRFDAGDVIALRTEAADGGTTTRTLTFDGSGWTPALRWSELGDGPVRFAAFWPGAEIAAGADSYHHTVAEDQRTEEAYSRSDLLAASASGQRGAPVRLLFGHALSRLDISLSGGGFTADELAAAEITVRSRTEALLSLTGEGSAAGTGEVRTVRARNLGGGIFRAILPPQSVAELREGWLSVRIGGKEATFAAPETLDGKPFTELLPGREVTVRLNMERHPGHEEWAGRKCWTYGVRGPSEPAERIEWQEGCGWYDCDKVNPTGRLPGVFDDSRMCWAASASNMIHWWLNINSDKIPAEYAGPTGEYTDNLRSDIFQFFKDNCTNRGSFVLRGLNFYFNGVFATRMYPETDQRDPRAGFFFEQLGFRSMGTHQEGLITKEMFNSTIRRAMKQRQAVAFGFFLPGFGNHAVNLWGAEFDENGEVSHIYVVDNNDGPYNTGGARGVMYRKEVRYLPVDDQPGSPLGVYIPDSGGTNFRYRFMELTTLQADFPQ